VKRVKKKICLSEIIFCGDFYYSESADCGNSIFNAHKE